MMYFVEKPRLYAAVNNKGAKFCEWIKKSGNHIIPDELSKDAFIEGIRLKAEELNLEFPRTKPLVVSVTKIDNYCEAHIQVYPKEDPDKLVAIITIQRVLGQFRFSENVNQMKGGKKCLSK